MGTHAHRGRRIQLALQIARIGVAGAAILWLVVALIGGYRYRRQWTGAIAAEGPRVLDRWSPMRRTLAARWQDTWPRVRVAGGLTLFAGGLVAWFGVLVGTRGPLVVGAVLAVVLVVFPLMYLLWGRPEAW